MQLFRLRKLLCSLCLLAQCCINACQSIVGIRLGRIQLHGMQQCSQCLLMSILVGLPVALIGVLFRALAAGVIKKDYSLATAGVYALTRNPLYFGSSLLATGFAIMSANEFAAALIIVPFGLVYPTVMLREEAHLCRLFPHEFPVYRAKVPRFFPHRSFRQRGSPPHS